MIKTCARFSRNSLQIISRFCHTENKLATTEREHFELIDTKLLPDDDYVDIRITHRPSPLDKCNEDISHVAPYLKPSFNFAAYVNKSQTLQEFVRLGVDLYRIERRHTVVPFILGLDFEKDVKGHLKFLLDAGLKIENVGAFLTKNPLIFKLDLDDLQVRVNYLQCKRFTSDMISQIISKNPHWLMRSTQEIDDRLGFFQNEFSLTGNDTRFLAVRQPKLITYNIKSVKLNLFVLKEEMGFTEEEIKRILLDKPRLFMKDQNKMLKTFEYMHNVMKIPLETIAKVPEVLTCREYRLKQRHLFLEMLGKAQYDPKQPNYVATLTLISGDDEEFSVNTAGSSMRAFNTFLKSL